MLEVQGLVVNIGTANILRDADLSVRPSAMCGLIGRNGAGKTTFMRSVMGLLPVQSGRMEFDHMDLQKVHAYSRAGLGIGYMPEERRLVPEFTTEENVLLPAWATRLEDAQDRLAWIYRLMPEVQQFASRPATALSGGQQKLVALARALMCGSKLLLLDEPFEGVAPALARRLAAVLSDLKDEGLSVLLAESNEQHLADLLDHIYVIERGSIRPER
ncbi:MAG TPA: ATP-binding cassette domain-containing protein [bacterium]|nr:ATP-binding cassette domain-containing protein [bacterium]